MAEILLSGMILKVQISNGIWNMPMTGGFLSAVVIVLNALKWLMQVLQTKLTYISGERMVITISSGGLFRLMHQLSLLNPVCQPV